MSVEEREHAKNPAGAQSSYIQSGRGNYLYAGYSGKMRDGVTIYADIYKTGSRRKNIR